MYIGCHLSASKGYKAMGKQAIELGANTFAFFTRNPRGGSAKEIDIKDVEAFLKLAEENNFGKLITEINQVSKILKDNGIQLLYHNHDFEFYSKHNDEYIFDAIFSEADTDSIYPELDTCWVHYSGNDPIAYIKKYGNVEEVLHLKDFECKNLAAGPVYALIDDKGKTGETKGDRKGDGFEFRPTGSGRQNVPAILKAAEDTVIKYVIIEQDEHPTNTPLEDAKISIDYLRSIGY